MSSQEVRPGSRGIRFRNLTDGGPLDVLVIGGGMTGAPIYQKLCRSGYRVALVDKGDFSSGTSQASGMLVWGGLLYLKNLDFATVLKLCKARSELIRDFPNELSAKVSISHSPTPNIRPRPRSIRCMTGTM